MAQPWKTIETVPTDEGPLELRQRGERDFLITLDGLVLMNSLSNRSEIALGQLGCRHLQNHPSPQVLVGGLGMGCTLRAVLDTLPPSARVVVAELNPVVLRWCRGPLASLTDRAVDDPRVTVEIADVAEFVRRRSRSGDASKFDAVIYDLYKGPHHHTDKLNDPLYGSRAISQVRDVLNPGGVFAVWGENYDEGFVHRLCSAGFSVSSERPGRGGYRHAVFVAEMSGRRRRPAGGGRGRRK